MVIRNYLQDIEIVGAVLVYRERDLCRWSLDWLYANCDRVCVCLDNHDKETEAIVFEYRDKYPERTTITYSTIEVDQTRNIKTGYTKARFKIKQAYIRDCVCRELRKMHKKKPIDLLVWPDSDETFPDVFPSYLERFWNEQPETYMALGFVEVYDNFRFIISQAMSPHGRVFKYVPELTSVPWRSRTNYNPYYLEPGKPWKIRKMVIHLCQFQEEDRRRRAFYSHREMLTELHRELWILPRDVREMDVPEMEEYQPSPKGVLPKHPSFPLIDYINNKDKYLKDYPVYDVPAEELKNKKGYDTWGSHIHLFKKLFPFIFPKTIIEFGCGYFSTKYLSHKCEHLVSVETNKGYLKDIKHDTRNNDNITFLSEYPKDMNELLKYEPELVFVDCEKEKRVEIIQWALNSNIPYIVFHDSEKINVYHYDRLVIPDNYSTHVCTDVPKQTTLLTTKNVNKI